MPIYEFEGKQPIIPVNCFVHPEAVIIGCVELGEHCFVGAGAVLRGDYGKIVLGPGCAVEENTVIHSEIGSITILEEQVIASHRAIIHGPCLIKHNAVIGMGAIVSTGCELGEFCFLGAGSLLPPGKSIPARMLAVGNPAKITRDMDESLYESTRSEYKAYQDIIHRYQTGLKRL